MLLNPRAQKLQNSTEGIQPRIMCVLFNGNPHSTIISYYRPTKASDETHIIFDNDLSSFIRHIPEQNVLIICRYKYAKMEVTNPSDISPQTGNI